MTDRSISVGSTVPDPEVRAAGGVLTDSSGRIAVVWRPHRHDWSLPKGKQEAGETDEQTAIREVEEETGYATRIIGDLGTVHYADHRGRSKVVRYFRLELLGGRFMPNNEVSELLWLEPIAAAARVTYETDRAVIARSEPTVEPS